MGNDGGSIPDRRDLVRNKPKAEQADKANQTRARWFFCALSKNKLQEPLVSCPLGKLYNKVAVIEYLLDKASFGDGEKICGHIRSLKDVTTLTLSANMTPKKTESQDDTQEHPQFVCPFTLKEMNGAHPFVYISTCGCVFSQAGLKTVIASSPKQKPVEEEGTNQDLELCPQCGNKYNRSDALITLNPAPDEEELMRLAMERRRLAEPPKKSKKRKNALPQEAEEPAKKKSNSQAPGLNPSVSGASRSVVSSLAMEEAKRKASMTDAVKSLYGDGRKRKDTFLTMGTFTRYA